MATDTGQFEFDERDLALLRHEVAGHCSVALHLGAERVIIQRTAEDVMQTIPVWPAGFEDEDKAMLAVTFGGLVKVAAQDVDVSSDIAWMVEHGRGYKLMDVAAFVIPIVEEAAEMLSPEVLRRMLDVLNECGGLEMDLGAHRLH